MTPENSVNLKKEFASFKERLFYLFTVELNKLDCENLDGVDFINFVSNFYLPTLYEMATFWSKRDQIEADQIFTLYYACLDTISKLITENGNLKELIDKTVINDRYQHLINFFSEHFE
jgi:hypothetical protein